MYTDFLYIIRWWFLFFLIGIIFLPFTKLVFSKFWDKGYIFSKIIGIIFTSYTVFLIGTLRILPFINLTVLVVIMLFLTGNIYLSSKSPIFARKTVQKYWKIFIIEEFLFLAILTFWSFVRANLPDIHGLEKYMDFGFINSILRSNYFPPKDMWFTPFSINYYYFGHFTTAVLTKLSDIPSPIAYNLMLATLAAFTFTTSFSIGINLIYKNFKFQISNFKLFAGGLLTAFLVTFAGNLHALYSFFKPYINESPQPFWQLPISLSTFPNSYWYPNATRFIHNTIHEFPIYSFVVSDLHGHVLDIPFVLLAIAILLSLIQDSRFKILDLKLFTFHFSLFTLLLGFLLAIMYMTNAWDGIIYFLLTALILAVLNFRDSLKIARMKTIIGKNLKLKILNYFISLFILGLGFMLFSLPFSLNFKPFVSGIGILCAPPLLTNIGKIGPFLFEADHCQKSPLWQMGMLYGFFYFWVLIFILKFLKFKNLFMIENLKLKFKNSSPSDLFVLILIFISTLLIIIPEFIYAKDIYPAHYRANTMFKLVYESFIMLSIVSGYIIIRLILNIKFQILNFKSFIGNLKLVGLVFIGIIIFFLVSIYPYFSTMSFYGNLQTYHGLDGLSYLKIQYPDDYDAITWLNKNIKGQPVILEAQGDSYTDYARVSANTGLPTVLGWTVHEWLWRGKYEIPAPRISEIQTLYESEDISLTKKLIMKYKIHLVFIGNLEKQKYKNLNIKKFDSLGNIIFQNLTTKIYKMF